MAEVVGLVASFIAIGQTLAALPKVIDALISLTRTKKDIASLLSEVRSLKSKVNILILVTDMTLIAGAPAKCQRIHR
jgi:hypothetical protein